MSDSSLATPYPLRSFDIAGVLVDPPLVLAPMAGLTDVTFRRVVRSCGGVGLTVSEIVSSEGLLRGAFSPDEYLSIGPGERPVSFQLAGANPERMAEAAKYCAALGADIIDINMGCPAPKVTKGFCGAALLRDPAAAAHLAEAVVRAVSIPVTVKMRLGWSPSRVTFLEVGRALEESGVAALCLHARTREQGYSGIADWKRIAELKAAVRLPVIGNGDATSAPEILRLFADTGCDGVMVGRAAVKNPWIFRQAVQLARHGRYDEPTLQERVALMRHHFSEILETSPREGQALHRMKSFLGKYTFGIPGAHALRAALNTSRSCEALLGSFEEWASKMGAPFS